MKKNLDKEALEYHAKGKPGKVDVRSSKKCDTEYALSLAYSPGVAAPCIEISKNPADVYKYTTKGNLVAVISNGTAILGLGNLGPLAAKPVMEGKGVLFKQFAGIDVYDIEINANSSAEFIASVKSLEPTFGGINLEDIAAPECFEIEETLKKEMKIPVFHDDQHGTAIISGAALINSCLLTKRKLSKIKVVFNGGGAAAISCARIFIRLGVDAKNIIMCDSRGVIFTGRKDGMNKYKEQFAIDTKARTLAEAMNGSDVFVGLSTANVVTKEMVKSMAKSPIVLAMANPDPEILPEDVKEARPDAIVATGRSDYPNQVNNVLGFPSIFRGALDVQATTINEEMKLAAVNALAELARQDVPDSVSAAYANKHFHFGPDYIIPKPFDPRVLMNVAPAVAKAAMDTGVAQKPITDLTAYRESLEALHSQSRGFIRSVINRIHAKANAAKSDVPIIIFPEGTSTKILRALNSVNQERIVRPILIGYPEQIENKIKELELEELKNIPIIHPSKHEKYQAYVDAFYNMRSRRGILRAEAERLMADPYYFSAMAVKMGDAHGLVSGATNNYSTCVKPILQIIGTGRGRVASGMNMVLIDDRFLFFSDTTVNINPSAEQLASIAVHVSKVAQYFNIEPRVAMLSYTNFTAEKENPRKMREAAEIVRAKHPELIVDGEMQADTAVNADIMRRIFPFSHIKNGANILIFPNLDAGNIAYKLVQQLSGGEVLGPFLLGTKKPANVLQRTCTVNDVVNTIVLTSLEAQAYMEM
ncbi:MAG: NAD-binding malic protein [Bdellovibrionales bacterium RBG_16_40_8]|nr:MAG: NAD-binding malic protein [Bdellovibrionales bacterium RBG_16_40_8]